MHIVALPGRRVETETWLKSLLVASRYPDVQVTHYRHWDAGAEASVAFEAARLSNLSPQLVVAKSLGTIIAAAAFSLHEFRPASAILIGTPYSAIVNSDLHLLREFAADVETLFIQQTEDPGGSAAQLATALQVNRGEVVEVPGSDHLYSDIDALAKIFQRWTKQHTGL